VLFVYGVAAGPLYRTESLRAIIGRECLHGHWLFPVLYGEPFLTKPPGHYAAIGLCSLPCGDVTVASARLPSVLAATVAVFLVYFLFRRPMGEQVALLAALLVAKTGSVKHFQKDGPRAGLFEKLLGADIPQEIASTNIGREGNPLTVGADHRAPAVSISGLAPDVLVLIGEVTQAWSRIEPILRKVVASRQSTHAKTKIVPTDPMTRPRLRGVIALVLQKHFGAPNIY
jgi:hypothetical protein